MLLQISNKRRGEERRSTKNRRTHLSLDISAKHARHAIQERKEVPRVLTHTRRATLVPSDRQPLHPIRQRAHGFLNRGF